MADIERSCCLITLLLSLVLVCESRSVLNASNTDARDKIQGEFKDINTHSAPVPRMIPKHTSNDGSVYKLKNDPDCKDDIEDYCSKEARDGGNFALLVCLQNQIKEDELSEECHQALWKYKNKIIQDPQFEGPAIALCQEEVKNIPECSKLMPGTGDLVPCLVENRDAITKPRCKHVVNKLAQIMFSDYRLLKKFYKDCKDDVIKYSCGRQDPLEKGDFHSQGSTLECLEEHAVNLTVQCQQRILRVGELQSDDYHLNRALYYACQEDRERFCGHVEAGEGRVYNCLMKRKFDALMSVECREKLTVKQKVEAKNYKANYPFLESCKKEIKENQCLLSGAGTSPSELAKVLLCLESALNDGAKLGGRCYGHMKDVQQELMEDYSINPAVVAHCDIEIRRYCGRVEKGGKTLDCLMEKAMEKDEPKSDVHFSKECYDAISQLLRETGAGGDFKVDATLRDTCRLPAAKLCKDSKNDMSVLSCLMEKLYHKDMGKECHEQLMHLQFFLARDFRMDEALYRACKEDAKNVCAADHMGDPDKDNAPSGMTLACLYRHILPNVNPDPKKKVSTQCTVQVMKTMHQRAADVKLMPHIQTNCLKDLAKHCSNKQEPGEEIKCLQDNLEQLESHCQDAIKEFTEEESEDVDLDKALIKHCSEMVKEFCENVLENNDAEGVLPCLFKHKYEKKMDSKCRAELEHRELVEMKDYQFSAKFKQACKRDVKENCPQSKTKSDVIQCLSLSVRNALISQKEHKISKSCRSQLRVEKLQQAEDIKFDPKLYGACSDDAEKLCADIHKEGPAAVLECLKSYEEQLSEKCKSRLFEREKEEAVDKELDVRLFRVCKAAIKEFCNDRSPDKVLECLKKHKRDMNKDYQKCRDLVFTRMKIALKDLDLNPELKNACEKDVPKFCKNEMAQEAPHDQIIPCLKKHIKDLSEDCEAYVVELEEESALDYRLNPALAKACEKEIDTLCGDKETGEGEVMECLKTNYKKIPVGQCRQEVREALIEERTDIMADPVLFDECSSMVKKYCDDVRHGRGRILQCLLEIMEKGRALQKQCRNALKARKEMWKSMQISGPESLTDLASAVSNSPRRNYFFIVFSCVLAVIFIGGLVSGRLSKRIARDVKNR